MAKRIHEQIGENNKIKETHVNSGNWDLCKVLDNTSTKEVYTKADMVDMLTDIRDEIASNYLIDADTGKIISGILHNFKAQKLLDKINNEIDKFKENKDETHD